MNIYLDLTVAFNRGGRLRAVICSGQAVVLHRLAVMSKDGDWILREDEECLLHVLEMLGEYGASYRFGAPLDLAWMRGGWSSHFEFAYEALRIRADFFTRPPRLSESDLDRLWREQEGRDPPFVGAVDLARLKMTQREKDYPVIGELARLMPEPADQMRYSRSARDLVRLCADAPRLASELSRERPLLSLAAASAPDLDLIAEALDAERRSLIKEDAARLAAFGQASLPWREQWPEVQREIEGLPLREAHRIVAGESRTMPAEGTISAAPLKDAPYPVEDRFLSEEDLDLANLSWDELIAVWNAWLRQASATNEAGRAPLLARSFHHRAEARSRGRRPRVGPDTPPRAPLPL
jgi:hypothetical protein